MLTAPVRALLAVVLVVIAAVQPFVTLTAAEHTAVVIVTVSFAAVGISPELAAQVAKLIPLPLAHFLGLVLGVLTAVVQNVAGLPDLWKAIIGAFVVVLVAIGIVPYTAAGPPAASGRA